MRREMRITLPGELIERIFLCGIEAIDFKSRNRFTGLISLLSHAWHDFSVRVGHEHSDFRVAARQIACSPLEPWRTSRLAVDPFTIYELLHLPATTPWVEEEEPSTPSPSPQEISVAAAHVLSCFTGLKELYSMDSWRVYSGDWGTLQKPLAQVVRLELQSSSTPDVASLVSMLPSLKHLHLADHHCTNKFGGPQPWRFLIPKCQLVTCFITPAASAGSQRDFLMWLLGPSSRSLRVLELPDAVSEEVQVALDGLYHLQHLSRPCEARHGALTPYIIRPGLKSLALYSSYPSASCLVGFGESASWTHMLATILESRDASCEAFSIICLPPFSKGTDRFSRYVRSLEATTCRALSNSPSFMEMWKTDCSLTEHFCRARGIAFESYLLPSPSTGRARFPSYYEISGQRTTLADYYSQEA